MKKRRELEAVTQARKHVVGVSLDLAAHRAIGVVDSGIERALATTAHVHVGALAEGIVSAQHEVGAITLEAECTREVACYC